MLQLTDGVTTVTLSGGTTPILACDYFPQPPDRNGDGWNDVPETARVIMEGTAASIINAVNGIERMLQLAADHDKRGASRRVFLLHSVAGLPAYRSEVLEGRVVWDGNALYRRLPSSGTTAAQVAVIWRRRYYWEANDETALTGSTITNDGNGNFFSWNSISGSLPTPVRITLTNVNGVQIPSRRFYIHNDVANVFGTDLPVLVPGTGASSWTGGSAHNILRWPLAVPTALANKLQGERYRLLAAFSSLPSGIYVRASIYAEIGGVYILLRAGGDVLSTGLQLLDLGAFHLPPAGNVGTASLVVVLTIYATASGSATLLAVQLAPSEPALTLRQIGFNLPAGASVVYDGMEDAAWLALPERSPAVEAQGELLLYPGQTNKIRILFDEETVYAPTRQLQVAGAYRPRKLTV